MAPLDNSDGMDVDVVGRAALAFAYPASVTDNRLLDTSTVSRNLLVPK